MAKNKKTKKHVGLHIRLLKFLLAFIKLGFVLFLLGLFIATGLVIGFLKGYQEKLPNITDKSFRPKLTTEIYDRNGLLLAKLHAEENRSAVLSIQEIPQIMQQSVIAIEDERFYQHFGIDLKGIMRALSLIVKNKKVSQGGSTLTQQLIKNAFLTPERTLKRKIKEALLSIQLERKYSKSEILQYYLNEIYFGSGAYGVEAAAQTFFGKPVKEITLAQSAMLAAAIANPRLFSPTLAPAASRQRTETVLWKMKELGFISPSEKEAAVAELDADYQLARELTKTKGVKGSEEFKAPYFVTYVRDQIIEKYGANEVYTGGLKVYTTLDYTQQQAAEEAFVNAQIFQDMKNHEHFWQLNGGLIAVEPQTGAIRAMVGGRDFQKSEFNRTVQAKRQPGSSFKPIIYACAIHNKFSPAHIVVDEPIEYKDPYRPSGFWRPENYDHQFHGSVILKKALEMSYNIVAIRLLEMVGVHKVVTLCRDLGISTPIQPYLSMALGSCEVTLLDMATAYGVFANGGLRTEPISITRIVNRDGLEIESNRPVHHKVLSEEEAYILTNMMMGVVSRGTGRRALIGRPQAGKTGTTSDYIDAWYIGYTPDLVAVVQFGFDEPKPLGGKRAGGTVAAPVWKAFMEKALKDSPKIDWIMPATLKKSLLCETTGLLFKEGQCPPNHRVEQAFLPEHLPTVQCRAHEPVAEEPEIAPGQQNIFHEETRITQNLQQQGNGFPAFGTTHRQGSEISQPATFNPNPANPYALPAFQDRLIAPNIRWQNGPQGTQ